MKENIKSILTGINFETALLEACDWNDELCSDNMKKISEYFQVCEKADLDIIKVELSYIFSENISDMIINYIKDCTNINTGVLKQ
jgi:hypothetical protein